MLSLRKFVTHKLGNEFYFICLRYQKEFVSIWLMKTINSKTTREAFPAAKIRKEGCRKLFNVWAKLHFSNFEAEYRRFLGHENACRWFLNRYKQLFGVSWKMFEMKFKFSKLVKSIVFRCLRTNKTVGCSEYSKRFVKENKKYLFKRSLNL